MARLSSASRNALPSSAFAGPGRSFPIEDANHARAALSMAHYAPDPEAVKDKVKAKYPSIGKKADPKAVRSRVMDKLKSGGKC